MYKYKQVIGVCEFAAASQTENQNKESNNEAAYRADTMPSIAVSLHRQSRQSIRYRGHMQGRL